MKSKVSVLHCNEVLTKTSSASAGTGGPKRATAQEKREQAAAAEAERRARLLQQREQAVLQLRFEADSAAAAHEPILKVLQANLMLAGLDGANAQPEMTVKYNDYNARGREYGFLDVSISMDWPALKDKSFIRLTSLLEGLGGKTHFSYFDDGLPLYRRPSGKPVVFGIPLTNESGDEDKDLVLLKATVSQERALRSALKELGDAQEAASVRQSLQSGTGPGAERLRKEQALQQEIATLEEKLQELREELQAATQHADEVRKRYRDVESPATRAIRTQLNQVREKLGLKPM